MPCAIRRSLVYLQPEPELKLHNDGRPSWGNIPPVHLLHYSKGEEQEIRDYLAAFAFEEEEDEEEERAEAENFEVYSMPGEFNRLQVPAGARGEAGLGDGSGGALHGALGGSGGGW